MHFDKRGCLYGRPLFRVRPEAIKHRYNHGRENDLFFYRDSNRNEVYIILKQEGKITAIEVKSSMTYSTSFEVSLRKIQSWINTPVRQKIIAYNGDFENEAGDIKIVNIRNLQHLFPIIEE